MSVLIFLGVLFILVLVHELGHFAVAKWTKMRVDEFGIGFPPKLFGIKKGETEYTFNLFPVGGFVKIFGEDGVGTPSSPVSSETRDRRSEALAEAGEGGENSITDGENRPDEDNRSFTSRSKWAQSAVLLAGVTMNILFAWFLVAIAFGIGVQASVSEEEASENAQLTITQVLPEGPASDAQIASGAIIKSVASNGVMLERLSPSAFTAFVSTHTDAPLTIVYTYKGEPQVVELRAEKGVIAEKPDQYAIGIALSQIDIVKRSVGASIADSFMYVATGLVNITTGIFTLAHDAILGKADMTQVAGPIGIVGLVGEASAFGITALLMFTAFISLNLAVINILPFPALDGGRLLFVIIEAVKGSPITPRYVATANMIGFFILIVLMVAVTWNDIVRLG